VVKIVKKWGFRSRGRDGGSIENHAHAVNGVAPLVAVSAAQREMWWSGGGDRRLATVRERRPGADW